MERTIIYLVLFCSSLLAQFPISSGIGGGNAALTGSGALLKDAAAGTAGLSVAVDNGTDITVGAIKIGPGNPNGIQAPIHNLTLAGSVGFLNLNSLPSTLRMPG